MKRTVFISSKTEFKGSRLVTGIRDASGGHAQPKPRPTYVYLTPADGGRQRTMVSMSATNALQVVLGPDSFKIAEEREGS